MTTTKTIGAAASSLLLLSSAALAAAPVVMDITADAAPAGAVERTVDQGAETVGVQEVVGQFSYDQGVVTSNEAIASVFAKAAATLCRTAEVEGAPGAAGPMQIMVEGVRLMQATVDDLAAEEGADSYTIGCSCASNVPGGGAIANAEVSGVSLASLAAMTA